MLMTTRIVTLIALLLLAAPAAAQKVAVDYDRQADFQSYRTFAWADTPETSVADSSASTDSMIKNAVEYWLTDGGLIEVDEDPDLWFTYHTNAKKQMQLNTTNYGYSQGGWLYAGSPTTTTTSTHTQGTLVIDAWDAERKALVWRGTATAVVPDNPAKGGKKIDKAVKKIVRKWRKMYQQEQEWRDR
jgi:hypothetical protein